MNPWEIGQGILLLALTVAVFSIASYAKYLQREIGQLQVNVSELRYAERVRELTLKGEFGE